MFITTWVRCDGTSRETDRIGEGPQDPEANTQPEGEDREITIANYHCSVLFVLLNRFLYQLRQHGCFHFRLASVARSGT